MGMMINSDQSDDYVIGTLNTTPCRHHVGIANYLFNYCSSRHAYRSVKLPEEKIRLMPPPQKFSSQSIKLAIFLEWLHVANKALLASSS